VKFLYAILACLFLIRANAQFAEDSTHYYYVSVSSTGTYNRTNQNQSYLFNNGLKFSTRKKNVALNFLNKWLYGQQNKVLTNNDGSSYLDVNLYKGPPRFNYWGLVNYNTSYSLKINSQLQSGLGVTYAIIDKKAIVLKLSDGIIYDYSNLTLKDKSRQVYGTPRNSFRLQIKCNYRQKVFFTGIGFLQNSLQYASDYIVRTDLSLSVKIKKWLSFTSAFSYNLMSRNKTENLFLTYGLVFENYFGKRS